jgi:signal transduction histidine kinase
MATARQVERRHGESLGSVFAAHDVTRLMNSIHVRDEFLASVSHEMKTPLTNIIGYLDVIDADGLGIAEEIAIVQKNADRMLTLVADLLQSQGGHGPVHRTPVDVSEVVDAAVAAIRPSANAARVDVVQVAGPPLVAEVDAERIGQVLGHLLSNAVKFSLPRGRVTVSVARSGSSVSFRVADSGVGIALEDQRQIFHRFFRAHSARQASIPGAGLGLAIAKNVVDAHDGSIHVHSVPGSGSVFEVLLPLRVDVLQVA